MKISSLALAEAIAIDNRGAPTLVGFEMRFLSPMEPPSPYTLVALVTISDEDDPQPDWPDDCTVVVRLSSPSGEVVYAVTQQVDAVPKTWLDLPAYPTVHAYLALIGETVGKYEIEAEVRVAGERVDSTTKAIFIVPPS